MNATSPSDPDPAALNVDPAAAAAALTEIHRITERLRKIIAHGPASSMLILWGIVWGFGFAITDLAPEHSGLAWLILDSVGILASVVIGIRAKSPVSSGHFDSRVLVFWLALFFYAGLWLWMFQPVAGIRIGAYFATVPMFGYVVGGLWVSRFFVWLGLAVTTLTVLGLTLLPGHFNLWMSAVGGGSLVLSGIYIRLAWR